MARKKEVLNCLKNTYCRLKPSKIEGVGVFAVRDIPKNINPFEGIKNQRWYEFKLSELKGLDKEILKSFEKKNILNGFLFIVENC